MMLGTSKDQLGRGVCPEHFLEQLFLSCVFFSSLESNGILSKCTQKFYMEFKGIKQK